MRVSGHRINWTHLYNNATCRKQIRRAKCQLTLSIETVVAFIWQHNNKRRIYIILNAQRNVTNYIVYRQEGWLEYGISSMIFSFAVEYGLTSHSTHNRSFWTRFSQPISWLVQRRSQAAARTADRTAKNCRGSRDLGHAHFKGKLFVWLLGIPDKPNLKSLPLPYLTFRVDDTRRWHPALRPQVGPLRVPVKPVG